MKRPALYRLAVPSRCASRSAVTRTAPPLRRSDPAIRLPGREEKLMSAPEPSAKAQASSMFTTSLAGSDPEVADAIGRELGRQRDEIELIASENIVSRAVLEAAGSVLT